MSSYKPENIKTHAILTTVSCALIIWLMLDLNIDTMLIIGVFNVTLICFTIAYCKPNLMDYKNFKGLENNIKVSRLFTNATFPFFVSCLCLIPIAFYTIEDNSVLAGVVICTLGVCIWYCFTALKIIKIFVLATKSIVTKQMFQVVECENTVKNTVFNLLLLLRPEYGGLTLNEETGTYEFSILLSDTKNPERKGENLLESIAFEISFLKDGINFIKSITLVRNLYVFNKLANGEKFNLYNHRTNGDVPLVTIGCLTGPKDWLESEHFNSPLGNSEITSKIKELNRDLISALNLDLDRFDDYLNNYNNEQLPQHILYPLRLIHLINDNDDWNFKDKYAYTRLTKIDPVFIEKARRLNNEMENVISLYHINICKMDMLQMVKEMNKSNKAGGREGARTRYQKLFEENISLRYTPDRVNVNFKITE